MRSGAIKPEPAEHRVDRRDESLPLWERGEAARIELPWTAASELDPAEIGRLVASAPTAVLVVGATTTSRGILEAALSAVRAPSRLYVYGDRALETDAAMMRRIVGMGDRALIRLGHRPPADWLVVDQGREGRLVLGPSAADRRWVVSVDSGLARSLFEAFRVLFWFHAAREALPDTGGTVALRTPLAAPFASPGSDVELPAGRLRLGGSLVDPVPDAEIRISSISADPGRARLVCIPPADGLGTGATGRPVDLAVPLAISARGHSVLWLDTGLPRATVTRQRIIVDLVETPIALQLEWPRAAAVDLFHRVERAAKQPDWNFYPTRRLREVRGPVLLDGGVEQAEVVPTVSLDVGDVRAPLLEFDGSRPARLPEAPALALQVVYRWRQVPVALPAGARQADIVRKWTALDEWASRQVESARSALSQIESQEGLLTRLRRWLPSRDASELERRKLRDEVDEIGESRPSQMPEEARDCVERIREIAARLEALRSSGHDQRQAAEDAQAEEAQRDSWEQRVGDARRQLDDARRNLATNEAAQREAAERQQAAQAALEALVASQREERASSLDVERASLEAALEAVGAEQKALNDAHKGRPPKAERKDLSRRVMQAEQALARNKRDREGVGAWSPSGSDLGAAPGTIEAAKAAVADLRAEAKRLSSQVGGLERSVAEQFRFEKPPRLASPAAPSLAVPPPVPSEAPPELGDLYEHQGERFLAIRTWEQLKRSEPVARRLNATLVVAPTVTK